MISIFHDIFNFTKDKRKCIFCNDPLLTKEHIYPVWSFEMFDIPDTKFNPSTRIKSVVHERYSEKELESEKKLDSHHYISYRDYTVKAVCAKCNGGWMSELEGKVKCIFQQLLEGKRIETLSVEESFDLSRWAILKIVLIAKTAQFPFEFDEFPSHLLRHNYIPEGFIVEATTVEQKGFNYQISQIDPLPLVKIDQEQLTLAQDNSFLGVFHFGNYVFRISYLKTSISVQRMQATERLTSLYPYHANLPFIEGESKFNITALNWDQIATLLAFRLRICDHYSIGTRSYLFLEEGFIPIDDLK